MRKIMPFIVLFIGLIAGCGNQDLNKQQYYEKGLNFFESGNPNGAIIAFKKAIEQDQSYFEARYQLASAYILRGKYESAERELLKVLRLNPSFYEAHMSLAKSFLSMGEIDDAIEEINLYLQNKDDNPEAYELSAAAYAAKKDYAKAEEILYKSLKMSPGRISSKIALADVYMADGKTSRAETFINEVLESDDKNKDALYLLARIQHKQDNVDDLLDTYQRIVDMDPGDIPAQFQLGLTYLRKNNLEKAKETAGKLIESHKKRPEGLYLMGLVYFQEKKIDEAIISFQESVKKASIPGAYYYLGLSHMAKGNLEQATGEFQRLIDMRPEMVQARLLLAVTHLKGGRAEDAEREAQKALEMDNNNAFAHNLLGSVYLALGKGDPAMKEFDRAIELNPKLVDAHIKKGAFNLLSGNAGKAEKEFINAVEIAPDLLNSRIILAQHYIKNKKFEDAIKVLNEGLKENPDDAILYNIMGAAYLGAEDTDKAGQYFEKAIASNPEFFLPYFNLALFYLNANEKERAIIEYKRVLDIDKDNVPALLMLAKIMESDKKDKEALSYYIRAKEQKKPIAYISLAGYYQRKKDGNKAIEALEEALSIDPDNIKTKVMMGRAYIAVKDLRKAMEIFKALEKSYPEYAAAYFFQAGILERMGKKNSAVEKHKKILELFPDYVPALNNLAYLYAEGYGPVEKAVDMAQRAKKLAPGDGRISDTLGWVFFKAGNYDDALKNFMEAADYLPDEPTIQYHLGLAYFKKGMNVKAEEQLENAIRLGRQSAFPEMENAKKELEAINYRQVKPEKM